MEQLSERLQTPISTAELQRRWAAVRAAMDREQIDVLLMQTNNDHMGGYVKYFTELPATNGYPLTVVFPRDDLMTLVSQGPFGGVTHPAVNGDGVRRGVQTMDDNAEFRLMQLYGGLRCGTRGTGALALRGEHHRTRRHGANVVCAGRLFAKRPILQHALCRSGRSR